MLGGAAFALAIGRNAPAVAATNTPFRPNAYLQIDPDGTVSFWVKKCEMGQQIHTAIGAMVADELGADMATLQLKQATTDGQYGFVGTGGSYAVPAFWASGRPLLAAAREMLLEAAAQRWNLDSAQLSVADGVIAHPPSGRRVGFGDLVVAASKLEVPQQPRLRSKHERRYVGSASGRRDAAAIVNGTALYGADVRPPGLRFAAIAKSPTFAGALESYERQAALAIDGVDEVVATQNWVAVVARNSWAAMRGRDALQARWEGPIDDLLDSAQISQQVADALELEGKLVRESGKPLALDEIEQLSCRYSMPMAQHAALEPVNATAQVQHGHCTIWAPVQMATQTQQEVAAALDLAKENVRVHTTLLGGAFGRKLERGFAIEAAQIAAQTQGPIQLIYSREDDMTQGGVRPPSCHRFDFAFDRSGGAVSMDHRYAVASPFAQQDPAQLDHAGYDWTGALGATDVPYAFDHLRITQRDLKAVPVPLNWWRGTFRNHHAYASECAIDELAGALDEDPLAFRQRMLSQDLRVETFPNDISHLQVARLRAVLGRAADEIDYSTERPPGRAVGLACHSYSDVGTYVAHAIEVNVKERELRIERVVAVVDCGVAISPDAVRAQMEGSVVFGLSSALWGEVAVQQGAIQTRNFDRCRLLRMAEMPSIDVHIIDSDLPPGGMGEPPLPSVTPALINAIARAGGPRVRDLPIGERLQLVS